MEECEKRRARRRGCQTLAQAFAKGKRARTDNGPAAGEDLLREAEDENLGQDGGVNLEVGGGILDPNANIGVEINNRDIQDNYNFGEVNANVKEGVDGAMGMEKMGDYFQTLCLILASKGALYMTLCYYAFKTQPSMCYILIYANI